MRERQTTLALAKAAFSVAVWAASFIATKIALREIAPAAVVWLRFGIGVAVLALFAGARKEWAFVPFRELRSFALLGFLGIAFHQWLQSTALVTAQASTSAWIITTSPVFIALLGWVLLHEKLGLVHVAGMAVAAGGVLLVVTHGEWRMLGSGQFGEPGDALVLISAFTWALFSVYSRRGLRYHSPTLMIFFVMAFGWLFSCPLFFLQGSPPQIAHLSLTGWLAILFLGILCSGLAYIFWYDALKIISASRVGALLYLEPLIAAGVAAAMLGEQILLVSVIGGALILLGVWMVNIREAEPGEVKQVSEQIERSAARDKTNRENSENTKGHGEDT
ncbi:DMT family transporter [bacterium]|nr:MAG: DMT family transporter [bacterium]